MHASRAVLLAAGALMLATPSCSLRSRPTLEPSAMAEFWEEPTDLERRDLFYGPGGQSNAPDPNDRFVFVSQKKAGTQPGYDVKDSRGRLWSVKLGEEARIEVAVSRLVSALGYHQPHVYYVPRWTLTHQGKDSVYSGARFRLEHDNVDTGDEWSWRDNPFLETRPFAGLLVLMVMVNNWDLKLAQNAVYVTEDADGGTVERRYMVRDLGASLGKTVYGNFGSKGDPEDFAKEEFIERVQGNRVYFHYADSWHEPQLLRGIAPSDVRWTCRMLARLSDKQWGDAFRAGGFSEAEAKVYIGRLKEKIGRGLNVKG